MFKKIFLVVLIAICTIHGPAHGAGYFGWQPFRVKKALGLKARPYQASSLLPRLQMEEDKAGMTDYGAETTAKQDDKEKRNGLQYGRFHLSFSRYHDRHVSGEALQPAGGMDLSAMTQYLQIPSDGEGFRHTMHTFGRIFTPQFDLGIEF